jgi:hypothetical protein
MFKALLLALAAAGLAGCMTAKNTLSLDDVATLGFAGAEVTVAPNASIWWGDGERAFAASKGQPATESENLAKTPEGQAYLRNMIAAKLRTAMEKKLSTELVGPRPVRVRVTVKGVHIASAIQRVIVGGQHSMVADVVLVDAKTGAALLPYAGQTAMAGAGQGVGGVLVDAALLGDPMDRVADSYAASYSYWLMRKEPPDLAGASSG